MTGAVSMFRNHLRVSHLRVASDAMCIVGGGALCLAAGLTVYSITARQLFGAPFLGDFELVELACVVVVSCFLPSCQFRSGHAVVESCTALLPQRLASCLALVIGFVVAMLYLFVAWQLVHGMEAMMRNREQTMVLGLSRYFVFPPLIASFALCALIALCQVAQPPSGRSE